MTARLVLPGDASREKWLEARRQGVTASEIATAMGLNPWDSAYALYHRKRGELPEQDVSFYDALAMRIGLYNEGLIAELFGELHPEFLISGDGRALYAHEDRPWQMCTPDRLVNDIRFDMIKGVDEVFEEYEPYAVLEAKAAGSCDGWGEDGSDQIPVQYRCQVLWQMDVMGAGTGYVACLFLHSRKLRVYEITMDGDARHDLSMMRIEAELFLCRVQDGNPPAVDWAPATGKALKRLHPSAEDREEVIPARMARAYHAACGRHKSAERAKARLENQIRERIGAARYAVTRDGQRVARRDVYELPAKTIQRKASTVNKLTRITPKGEPS